MFVDKALIDDLLPKLAAEVEQNRIFSQSQ
jgi:hypothetical protein